MSIPAPPPEKHFDKEGRFDRPQSIFRSHISSEEGSQFPPEANRYHLYVSYACPWAQRALIVRKLKGLEKIISFTAVHYRWPMITGWRFATAEENLPGDNVGPDPLHEDVKEMRELYFKVDPNYSGRFTVPVLWDKRTEQIVSNESSEIIRMFYIAFDSLLPEQYRSPSVDLYPESLRHQIDETNDWTYNNVNNGVYKCGLARSQEAYDGAVTSLFENLDRIETHLSASKGPYYFGDKVTEADVRLYVTIVRFDPVYVQHFKCNIRDIRSGYPAIHKWLRKLYWEQPAFRDTTEFVHIKGHYMESHTQINPLSIVSKGPMPVIMRQDEEVPAVAKAREAH